MPMVQRHPGMRGNVSAYSTLVLAIVLPLSMYLSCSVNDTLGGTTQASIMSRGSVVLIRTWSNSWMETMPLTFILGRWQSVLLRLIRLLIKRIIWQGVVSVCSPSPSHSLGRWKHVRYWRLVRLFQDRVSPHQMPCSVISVAGSVPLNASGINMVRYELGCLCTIGMAVSTTNSCRVRYNDELYSFRLRDR